jgi:hypothetical protein
MAGEHYGVTYMDAHHKVVAKLHRELVTVAAPGICNMVFICVTWYSFYKNYPHFAKIVVLLLCVEKNIGIHLNTREYPWRRPWLVTPSSRLDKTMLSPVMSFLALIPWCIKKICLVTESHLFAHSSLRKKMPTDTFRFNETAATLNM